MILLFLHLIFAMFILLLLFCVDVIKLANLAPLCPDVERRRLHRSNHVRVGIPHPPPQAAQPPALPQLQEYMSNHLHTHTHFTNDGFIRIEHECRTYRYG